MSLAVKENDVRNGGRGKGKRKMYKLVKSNQNRMVFCSMDGVSGRGQDTMVNWSWRLQDIDER